MAWACSNAFLRGFAGASIAPNSDDPATRIPSDIELAAILAFTSMTELLMLIAALGNSTVYPRSATSGTSKPKGFSKAALQTPAAITKFFCLHRAVRGGKPPCPVGLPGQSGHIGAQNFGTLVQRLLRQRSPDTPRGYSPRLPLDQDRRFEGWRQCRFKLAQCVPPNQFKLCPFVLTDFAAQIVQTGLGYVSESMQIETVSHQMLMACALQMPALQWTKGK